MIDVLKKITGIIFESAHGQSTCRLFFVVDVEWFNIEGGRLHGRELRRIARLGAFGMPQLGIAVAEGDIGIQAHGLHFLILARTAQPV